MATVRRTIAIVVNVVIRRAVAIVFDVVIRRAVAVHRVVVDANALNHPSAARLNIGFRDNIKVIATF